MNRMPIQSRTLARVTAQFGLAVLFAVLLFSGCGKQPTGPASDISVQPVAKNISSVESFAVLSGAAVTLTDATVNGDVFYVDAFTKTTSTVTGTVTQGSITDAAYTDFLSTYDAFGKVKCGTTLTGTLAGVTLTPGVYCFDAAAALTGTLTLDAQGDANAVWIFKIGTLGTGALTGTNFNVVMANKETCNNNVYWWVAEAATMTTSNFIGNILAGAAITVTGGTFNGNIYAKAGVTVTDGAIISSCGTVSSPTKPKANEGVGNGVDGNTPGHLHNGGNDDPAFSPGNPGAKHK